MTQYPKWMKPSLVLRLQEDAKTIKGIATPQQVWEFSTGVFDEIQPQEPKVNYEQWHKELGSGLYRGFKVKVNQNNWPGSLKREPAFKVANSWINSEPPEPGIYVATWLSYPWENSVYLRYFDGNHWHCCRKFNGRMEKPEAAMVKWYRRITREEVEQFITLIAN